MADEVLPTESLDAPDLLRGGLYYSFMQRFGVASDVAGHAARNALTVALMLWIPVAGLALIEGNALPGAQVAVPFFFDVSAYARSLLVVPLLLIARPILATAWKHVGGKLRERGVVGPESRAAADALAARVTRSARRVLPNAVCLGLALLVSSQLTALVEAEPSNTWFARSVAGGGSRLTWAGRWSAFVVHGVVFYLSLGWFWRLFLWYRYLAGIARLPLNLFPLHPDRAAGLGVVGKTIAAAAPLVLAWTIGLAAPAASVMLHAGEKVETFIPLGIGLAIVVLLLLVLPPVLILAPQIYRARRDALEEWGSRMARTGEGMRRHANGDEAGLEDLQIAVSSVRSMLPFPLALAHLLPLVLAMALPTLGLVLLAVPFREVLHRLVGLLR